MKRIDTSFETKGGVYMRNITAPKKTADYVREYESANCRHYKPAVDDIYKAYGRPSVDKVRAWEWCKALCYELNGEGLRIVSWNTFAFTVMFEFVNPTTAECCLARITRDDNQFVSYCHNYDEM